ncbi:LOW QUALITY PROTEIN: hypothetical protein PHMEG_00025942 [Phytophthora megakarya]|uniref:Peptidase A2 domain-containing protein n=1 Tax=Phytophthora megakarya TaxID=4795 RepID=A0A225VCI2_9STRA|nr:LOW QUALITY PROTEIN: hypothetical protein PHMEG_00025942 [Phytophthora megakarya]
MGIRVPAFNDPIPEISEPESQDLLEVPLKPGQRYGWWENHEHGDMHGLATIHGTVNDSRTRILLDTGPSVSTMSLDLARKLKPKLQTHRQIKVSGLGHYYSCPSEDNSRMEFYVLNIWVGNIEEGVDVLLGMNVMHSAGVRLCIREGLGKLPDEETVVMYDNDPKSRGMRTHSGCAYRGFPGQPGFVRPGKARYEEWRQLIRECTVSRQARMRAERLEQILREREPRAPRPRGISGLLSS